MAKKQRLIPFKWLPAAWGLSGKPLAEAEANYYYEGDELAVELLKIEHGEDTTEFKVACLTHLHRTKQISDADYTLKMAAFKYGGEDKVPARELLGIHVLHGMIDQYEYQREMVKVEYPDVDSTEHRLEMLKVEYDNDRINRHEYNRRLVEITYVDRESADYKIGMLKVDYETGVISKNEYEKSVANIKDEPWVGIVDHGYRPEDGVDGVYFEFDWNEKWIVFLRENGYRGSTPDEIVEQWFTDVCRSQTASDQDVYVDQPVPFNSGRVINRQKTDDGKTGYS